MPAGIGRHGGRPSIRSSINHKLGKKKSYPSLAWRMAQSAWRMAQSAERRAHGAWRRAQSAWRIQYQYAMLSALCPLPHCALPYALCPLPSAPCPMLSALCPMPYALCFFDKAHPLKLADMNLIYLNFAIARSNPGMAFLIVRSSTQNAIRK